MTFSADRLAAGREAIARLTEGLHLLARFHPPLSTGAAGGRQWERWIAHDLLARHATVSQGPGSLRLFESSSASGFRHELDGASRARWGVALLEAKAYTSGGPSKNDVCIFHGKTFDLVLARHQGGMAGPHWRVLASSGRCSPEVRKYCYLHGILLVDPELIPLPQLLRGAGKPGADEVADPMLWDELVRLAERTVLPFEGRYEPNGDHLWFNARWWTRQDLDDLLYVQTELTEQLFDYADEAHPEFFVDRAAVVLRSLGATAPADSTRVLRGGHL